MHREATISLEEVIASCPSLTKAQAKRLRALDTDGDGQLDEMEVLALIQSEHSKSKRKAMMRSVILLLLVASVVLVGAVCGVTYAVVAAVNDLGTGPNADVLASKGDASALAAGSALAAFPIEDMGGNSQALTMRRVRFANPGTGDYGSIALAAVQQSSDGSVTFRTWDGMSVVMNNGSIQVLEQEEAAHQMRMAGRRRILSLESILQGVLGTFDYVVVQPIVGIICMNLSYYGMIRPEDRKNCPGSSTWGPSPTY